MKAQREERLLAEREDEHEDRFARIETAVANLHDFVANHINTRLGRIEGTVYAITLLLVATIGAVVAGLVAQWTR